MIEYRTIAREEFDRYLQTAAYAFGFEPGKDDKGIAEWQEYDRTISAFDDGEIVGTSGAFSYLMNVPGGEAHPTGGVTFVAVRPTHRRRGVLTEMMNRQLADARERGEPLSALYASEAVIYGRFGYGHAAPVQKLTVDTRHAAFRPDVVTPGTLRLVGLDDFKAIGPPMYDRAIAGRPGTFRRHEAWWEARLYDPEGWREGNSARRFVVYSEDGEDLGYLAYRHKEKWEGDTPSNEATVVEEMALTPVAYAALWRYILSLDLVTKVQAWSRPVDAPLPWLFADPRRVQRQLHEGLWVRLVDVAAALAGRAYATDGQLVIEVADASLPDNAGRYRLTAGSDGATCERTDGPADVALDVSALGALYLGGQDAEAMAYAGLVDGDAEAVARLQAMFRWTPAPFCADQF
jgi:predicted acetyltransferase